MQLYETTAECVHVWVWVLKMCAALNSPSTLNSHASCNVFSWSVHKPYCALAPLHRSMRPCSRKLMVDCICLCARLPLPLLRHCNLSACVCVWLISKIFKRCCNQITYITVFGFSFSLYGCRSCLFLHLLCWNIFHHLSDALPKSPFPRAAPSPPGSWTG